MRNLELGLHGFVWVRVAVKERNGHTGFGGYECAVEGAESRESLPML